MMLNSGSFFDHANAVGFHHVLNGRTSRLIDIRGSKNVTHATLQIRHETMRHTGHTGIDDERLFALRLEMLHSL